MNNRSNCSAVRGGVVVFGSGGSDSNSHGSDSGHSGSNLSGGDWGHCG